MSVLYDTNGFYIANPQKATDYSRRFGDLIFLAKIVLSWSVPFDGY